MVVHLSIDFHRQKFVATYVVPARLGRDLRRRCPAGTSLVPAKKALRQWLRLHVLAPEDLEVPSLGVSLLWREFTSAPEFEHFSAHAYGHLANRKPSSQVLARRPDFKNVNGLALTFAMACVDQGLDTPHPAELPALFVVDGALNIDQVDGGQHWILNCGRSDCRVEKGSRCAYHELGPLVPTSLPKEIRFDVPDPFPLDGSSHRLMGPLY
ncbi:MAG TPA: hypothetical protein VL984_12450 [Acidimicrobiales bacterium]|nr:hypothetical protein [Acidimicrobiales bacterium]